MHLEGQYSDPSLSQVNFLLNDSSSYLGPFPTFNTNASHLVCILFTPSYGPVAEVGMNRFWRTPLLLA
jgi:hypothetical protein